MSRLTRKTNGKDYACYCRIVEMLREREFKANDEFYDKPEDYYDRFPYQEIDCGNDEERLIKLGKLEDLLEKYQVESIEELEEIIKRDKKSEDKIIELSADLGLYQNENISLTEDIEKYWQIEQELGCPLEIVLKGLKDGIVLENNKLYHCHLSFYDNGIFICYENGESIVGVSCKQYKKTWWLKGEKNE